MQKAQEIHLSVHFSELHFFLVYFYEVFWSSYVLLQGLFIICFLFLRVLIVLGKKLGLFIYLFFEDIVRFMLQSRAKIFVVN